MLSHRDGPVTNDGQPKSLIYCKKAVTVSTSFDVEKSPYYLTLRRVAQESLAALGLSTEGHAHWMIGSKRNNPDGRHIYYPTAALILTTWHLVDWLCAEEEEEDPVIRPLQGHTDLLTISLPILGSALNGIAKDAGHMWTWYIAHQMQSHGLSADMDDISMLLEVSSHDRKKGTFQLIRLQLVMPNMVDDPSDTTRFALHRLIGTLISLVDIPKDRITLYDQVRTCKAC